MNGDPGNPYYNTWKTSTARNLKKRFLVKLTKRFSVLNYWRNSEDSIKNSEFSKYKKFELSQGIDQLEECIFYYVNGVIQMATFPGSDK